MFYVGQVRKPTHYAGQNALAATFLEHGARFSGPLVALKPATCAEELISAEGFRKAFEHASMALPQYLAQVRGVPAHSCHATQAYKLFMACVQLLPAACTLKRGCCLPHLLVAGIHLAMKNVLGVVHASTKLHLLSSSPCVYSCTTLSETLLMSLTASFSTYALRVSCSAFLPGVVAVVETRKIVGCGYLSLTKKRFNVNVR